MQKQNKRIIISGGGTGGHIFPAISIANALKSIDNNIELLFVGASNRMEMEKVPAAGYPIVGLPISGFDRRNLLKNGIVLIKLAYSMLKARRVLRKFKPQAAVGVGGYASGPLLKVANQMGIPTIIQEQNSYAGVTNRLLAGKAKAVCVAYEDMEKYFPAPKIIFTGNPVRPDIEGFQNDRKEAYKFFNLNPEQPVLLVLGGSLGARTLANTFKQNIEALKSSNIQLIWQSGKLYFDECNTVLGQSGATNIRLLPFIGRMDLAYAAANIIISRAGAGTISELCLIGKPCILVPSPNVAEDHQTKNALALANKNAAILVTDAEAVEKLIPQAFSLALDNTKQTTLAQNISTLAKKEAAKKIAEIILKQIE
jgi:UDP-N-acetylglucosamine--N-acetylmuramyl-(pentapeptide) pyrophosphoryl-undecaprenol N-acetylglucosamine transferase